MSVTLDRLVCDVFEDDNLGRVADRVREGKADEHVGQLREKWARWADTWEPPRLPEGHLRPFAFNNYSGYDSGGLASTWMNLVTQPGGADQIDRQIICHLLFCDGIALPDPFFKLPDGESIVPRWHTNDSLAAVIETVDRLKELIRRNIVTVVPRQYGLVPEAAQAIGDTTAELFPPPPPDWYALPYQQVVALDLAAQIGTAEGALDPYLPTAGHAAVFHTLAKSADAKIMAAIGKAAPNPVNQILPELLRCPLPDPVGVTLKDIIAIRKEGHFDGWREAVAAGVSSFTQYVGNDPDGWPNSGQALRNQIAAAVRDKAGEAKKEIGWMKKPTVEAGVTLVLVGGTAAAAALLAAPVAAAIGLTTAVPTLAGIVSRYRFRNGAYARHVAVFTKR